MKVNKNLVLLILLMVVMITEPISIDGIYNSIYGKILILSLVVYFTINHTVLGLLATIILIASLQVTSEGFNVKRREGFNSAFVISRMDRLRVEEMFRPKVLNRTAFKKFVGMEPKPMNSHSEL
tara:strand:- start:83 stop:454 length:372 start_codon:yes stop_codon:yes gene_type:complete